jgi:hypothetical protein
MKMLNKEKKLYEIISDNGSYIYLDELNNVIYDADFKVVLGKISDEFRFIPLVKKELNLSWLRVDDIFIKYGYRFCDKAFFNRSGWNLFRV